MLVWHRRDLRIDDNSLYWEREGGDADVLYYSAFVFERRDFARRRSIATPSWDVSYTGPHAAACLIRAVASLRQSLRALGGDLIVREGDAETEIPLLAASLGVDEVRWHDEPGADEAKTSARVRSRVLQGRCGVRVELGCTLFHPEDLPLPGEWKRLAHPNQTSGSKKSKKKSAAPAARSASWAHKLANMPRVMGEWRRAARSKASPRSCLATRLNVDGKLRVSGADPGEIPSLEKLMRPAIGSASCPPLFGLDQKTIVEIIEKRIPPALVACTEESARARLATFLKDGHAHTSERNVADTKVNGSSKLSIPLALGCISPRQVYHAAQESGEGARWLATHMEMRDFFIYSALAAGPLLFRREGWKPVAPQKRAKWENASDRRARWLQWATGRTGFAFPDAAMRQLARSGYCSNRARQNAVASRSRPLHRLRAAPSSSSGSSATTTCLPTGATGNTFQASAPIPSAGTPRRQPGAQV